MPQHFESHANTPALLSKQLPWKEGQYVYSGLRAPWDPAQGLGHSRNKGIKQQSHCQPPGVSRPCPPQGSPLHPSCGVSECTCIFFFPEGGSALPTEFVPCLLLQVSALNTLLWEAHPDHLTPAAPLPCPFGPSSMVLLTLTHHACADKAGVAREELRDFVLVIL